MTGLGVALLSGALIALEVLLVRLFAIVLWHHFAYMAISIALLGIGASGTFLALARAPLLARFEAAFAGLSAGFAVTAIAGFALAQHLPFNPLALAWEGRQFLHLAALYGLLALPFFFAGAGLGLALMRDPQRIGAVYGANLAGAALGAVGMVGLLFVVSPGDALRLIAGLGALAGLAPAFTSKSARWRAGAWVSIGLAVALAAPGSWTRPKVSEFKGLARALAVQGAEIMNERSSPLALLSVVKSPTVPFRHAPGLSLLSPAGPPAQLAVFTDGGAMDVITAFDGKPGSVGHLDHVTGALPYHLIRRPEVLILGAGGGTPVLQAVHHRARRIDAVELNGELTRLVAEIHADFAGRLHARAEVHPHIAEPRAFLAASARKWDLIQIPASQAGGAGGLGENYLYTVEAMQTYVAHLKPGGWLAVTRPLALPPRESLKLFATALAALGPADGPRRLALVRSLDTTTLLMRNGDIGGTQAHAIRAFAEARAFDIAYLPGMAADEANRFNRLDRPYFHQGTTALAGPGRSEFMDRYKFDLRPATDGRPYFHDFFKWRTLPELLALRTVGGAGLLQWGYPILAATVLQAALLAALIILAPLAWRGLGGSGTERARIGAYFLCLGLAFLFLEIAFIQRLILFLGHPLYAVAVVLAGLLFFAGLGAASAPRFARFAETRHLSPITLAVLAIAVIAGLYGAAAGALPGGLAEGGRIAVALAFIAPLGLCMGLPFPLGLGYVARTQPGLVPWAWGINGCASVVAAPGATLLAIHLGSGAVIGAGVLFYLGAAVSLAGRPVRPLR